MKSGNRTIGRLRGSALVVALAIAGLFVAPTARAAPAASHSAAIVMNPGATIYGGGYPCTVSANVTNGTHVYFLMAGQCGSDFGYWYSDRDRTILIGTTVHVRFPDDDFAIGQYALTVTPGHTFTGAGDASLGQNACTRDVSGEHCGIVHNLHAAVDIPPNYFIGGQLEAHFCSEYSNLGTPLYTGDTVLGLLTYRYCAGATESYFQPITKALAFYGMTIY